MMPRNEKVALTMMIGEAASYAHLHPLHAEFDSRSYGTHLLDCKFK